MGNNPALSAGELEELLALEDFSPVYRRANQVRREQVGDIVHIRAILEFSNVCKRNCAYCGLRAAHAGVERYRMEPEEMVDTAVEAHRAGYRTLVMQSGEDPWYTPELLGQIVTEIKARTDLVITLSCGEMSKADYAHLRACGADRYLLKHETANPELYAALHPDGTLENRLRCLRDLKTLGYETGGGFMVGLPGQTNATLAQDLLTLASIPCDMAGIGPFISHPDTPLRGSAPGSTEVTKRCVALTRLLLPRANLPATTALGVRSAGEKSDVFSCGANVVMLKVTPTCYKRKYEIYPAPLPDTHIAQQRRTLDEQIRALGRIPC